MTSPPFVLILAFAAGVAVGVLYFRCLWWTTQRFAQGGKLPTTIAWSVARLVLLAGLLSLAAQESALALLLAALGVLIGRALVMRHQRGEAS